MTEPGRAQLSRLRELLSQPVDIAWLAAFRVLFGVAMAISMLRFLGYGWIDDFFITPKFHFKYWLFDWVEPLAPAAMYGLFWLLFALALCIALGLWFRVVAPLFVLGFAYLSLLDVAIYLNHYYLAFLLAGLLALSPAARAFSLDARRAHRRDALRVDSVPRFWLLLLRFQVGVVYTFAGLAKATGDWLWHAQPLNIWLAARTDLPLLGPVFAQPWAAPLMSWAGFLFDTTIVWWLLWPRARPYAYAAVLGFHLLTRLMFPIGMFPVIMVLAALVFFPPAWPRTLWARLRGGAAQVAPPALASSGHAALPLVSRWAVTLGALYCAFQLLFPLRFLAYGGDVLWHEQGMRFSWRVMVREKNGSVTYHVRSKVTGHAWEVSPGRWLTRQQEREMASQPDLILQFAHFLRDDFAARGLGAVEVRAETRVSLNGRPGAVLIDPQVDLASVADGMAKARWIRPPPSSQPPRVRPI